MSHRLAAAGVWLLAAVLNNTPAAADCGCGPDYCTNDPRAATQLEAKKKRLAKEYPENLIGLLDIGPQCVARIRTSPDRFSILVVESDDKKTEIPWSAESEDLTRKQLKSGALKRYWLLHSRRAFSCCGELSYDKMSDYDTVDDINTSRSIKCTKNSKC